MDAVTATAAIWKAHKDYGKTHEGHTGPFKYLVVTHRQYRDILVTCTPEDIGYAMTEPLKDVRFHGLEFIRANIGVPVPVNHAHCVDLRGAP